MRRPYPLKAAGRMPSKPHGFSLFIVLIMMIVIAFLVVAATQSYNTEMRVSSNDADRKMALAIAESALRQGESDVADFGGNETFSSNCANGLCAQAGETSRTVTLSDGTITLQAGGTANAWERACGNSSCLETNGSSYAAADASQAARYIIEFISTTTNANGGINTIYRVTARAWGQNANTAVTLQSYVETSD